MLWNTPCLIQLGLKQACGSQDIAEEFRLHLLDDTTARAWVTNQNETEEICNQNEIKSSQKAV